MRAQRVARWVLILVGVYLFAAMIALVVWGVGVGPDLYGAVALGLGAWLAGWLLDRRESADGTD